LKKKIDIIVEKPVLNNLIFFYKLKKLIKNFRNNFYINHSDLYNKNFLALTKISNLKKIKKINFYYGNNKTKEVIVNQKVTTSNGWVYLGNYNFNKNDSKHGIVLLSRNKLNVVVESIKFVAKNPVSAEYFNNNIIIEKFKSNNQMIKTNIEHFNPTNSNSLIILIFMFLVILGLVYIFYNHEK
jgi:hypothetical protein